MVGLNFLYRAASPFESLYVVQTTHEKRKQWPTIPTNIFTKRFVMQRAKAGRSRRLALGLTFGEPCGARVVAETAAAFESCQPHETPNVMPVISPAMLIVAHIRSTLGGESKVGE